MATTKSTTPRKRAPSRSSSTARTTAASTSTAKSSVKRDDSLVARTGRTIKERPYTSAAIATGAVTVVAAAAAAGAFLASRRDKSFKEASDELTSRVKGGFASASETVKDGFASASETVKDGLASATETVKELGQRGAGLFKGDGSDQGSETRTQQQIAEEALTLKETGTLDERSATEIKTGAIAY
jgi:hypothetical protein